MKEEQIRKFWKYGDDYVIYWKNVEVVKLNEYLKALHLFKREETFIL